MAKNKKTMTLFELLQLITSNDEVPLVADEEGCIDCVPQSVFKITLRFMSEEETAETVNISSPLLIPWYDCEVYSISPDETNKYTIEAWLMYDKHIKKHWKNRVLWRDKDA